MSFVWDFFRFKFISFVVLLNRHFNRRKKLCRITPPENMDMLIQLTRDGWYINGQLWDECFVKAIAPVEYQRIVAEFMRNNAKKKKSIAIKLYIYRQAKDLDESAKVDANCEVKWMARSK